MAAETAFGAAPGIPNAPHSKGRGSVESDLSLALEPWPQLFTRSFGSHSTPQPPTHLLTVYGQERYSGRRLVREYIPKLEARAVLADQPHPPTCEHRAAVASARAAAHALLQERLHRLARTRLPQSL